MKKFAPQNIEIDQSFAKTPLGTVQTTMARTRRHAELRFGDLDSSSNGGYGFFRQNGQKSEFGLAESVGGMNDEVTERVNDLRERMIQIKKSLKDIESGENLPTKEDSELNL